MEQPARFDWYSASHGQFAQLLVKYDKLVVISNVVSLLCSMLTSGHIKGGQQPDHCVLPLVSQFEYIACWHARTCPSMLSQKCPFPWMNPVSHPVSGFWLSWVHTPKLHFGCFCRAHSRNQQTDMQIYYSTTTTTTTTTTKPIWILLKQETVSGIGISWDIWKSAPHSRQITTPAPHRSVFYRPDALPVAQPTASKHWRHCTILLPLRHMLRLCYAY